MDDPVTMAKWFFTNSQRMYSFNALLQTINKTVKGLSPNQCLVRTVILDYTAILAPMLPPSGKR